MEVVFKKSPVQIFLSPEEAGLLRELFGSLSHKDIASVTNSPMDDIEPIYALTEALYQRLQKAGY